MADEVYYLTPTNDNEIKEVSIVDINKLTFFSAKMADDLVKRVIVKNIHDNVLNKVKEQAERGLRTYTFRSNKDVDYQYAIKFLSDLGYSTRVEHLNGKYCEITLRW